MAMDTGGGGLKRQRVDELDDQCEAVVSGAIPVDRISALPDELRLHVLTHLPLRDAIRTGALARGWRDLWRGRWTHRTSLDVHLRNRDVLRRELDALERKPRPRRRLGSSELQRFLDYAAECGVEGLHVETLQGTTASRLNFHLPLSSPALACLSLRHISVSKMYNKSARPFQALPKDLSRLNILTISYKALTGASVLTNDGVSAQLPNFSLHGLKELHLPMFQTKAVNLANLYLFLKTFECPNLERLFVQLLA